MTLLVISDSHGRYENILRVLSLNKNAAALLFLGDGLRDVERINEADIRVFCVRGNCDLFSSSLYDAPDERVLRFGEYNVMMMHGHTRGVKHSLAAAIGAAVRSGADILLYGHTHERVDEYYEKGETVFGVKLEKPLRVFNPGSIGAPRESGYSFGVIEIRNNGFLTSFGTV